MNTHSLHQSNTNLSLTAKQVVMNLLARRAYSQQQLRQKLKQRGYEEDEAEQALQFALDNHWLDDQSYAEQLLRSQLAKAYGHNHVVQYLQSKGISRNQAEQVLADADVDWFEVVLKAYNKKYPASLPSDWQVKAKIKAYLYRRGFLSEQISLLFEHLSEQS